VSKPQYGLMPYTFPEPARPFIDQDYIHKLSFSERAWLSKFNNEYYGNHIKKGDLTAFHNSNEHRKECRRRTYLMENDLLNVAHIKGQLEYLDEQEKKD